MEKLNKRIVNIHNEGNEFFIYYHGVNHYDENFYGKKIEKEVTSYLDENLNSFVINVDKKFANQKLFELLGKGYPVFIGPHSPEIEEIREVELPNGKKTMQEVKVLNNNPNTVGIWRVSSREEKSHYIRLLEKQAIERSYFKFI